MKQPDRFERMVRRSVGDPNELEIFGINMTTNLLRRLYAQIRREIRQAGIQMHPWEITSDEILDHLARWRRGKP